MGEIVQFQQDRVDRKPGKIRIGGTDGPGICCACGCERERLFILKSSEELLCPNCFWDRIRGRGVAGEEG